MFDKKKLNFWRLVVIFGSFTIITLISLWLSPHEIKATMMNESMANMASMHLNNVTIYDLVDSEDTDNSSAVTDTTGESIVNDNSQHHQDERSVIKVMGIFTTITIFALLPLLIFGTIIIAIVWIK